MADSKKHHFVPQSVLKRFSVDNENRQIYIYDKLRGKQYVSSILNAGSQNKFNTVTGEVDEFNMEPLFQEIDELYATVSNKILEKETYKGLTDNDFCDIVKITSHQLKRTNLVRTTIDHIDDELSKTLNDIRLRLSSEQESNDRLTSEQIKILSILSTFDLEEEMFALLTKGMYLIKNESPIPFIISDCPVIVHNSFPYAGQDIYSKGSEIYFPISPKFILAFCCKTLMARLVLSIKFGFANQDIVAIMESIQSDVPYKLTNIEYVEFYNQQQIMNSQRFVYSSTDDFSLVEETIHHMPETKFRQSTLKLGELGKVPINSNLPVGELMVIHSANDHGMFKIEIINKNETTIKFRCERTYLFEQILLDVPFQRIEFYRDQYMERLMGMPEIAMIDLSANLYEASFQDKTMDKLFEAIKKSKGQ